MTEQQDPTRWADDPSAPDSLRSALRAARRASPTPEAVDSMLANVERAAGQPAGQAARGAPSTPPPTQGTWHLGAKFWLGVLIPVCALALLLGRTTPPRASDNAPRAIARDPAPAAPDCAVSAPRVAAVTAPAALSAPIHEAVDGGARIVLPACDAEAHQRRVSSAQSKLREGDFAAVLSLARADRSRCPNASMAEDRERVAIEALVRSGRDAEAMARWRAFRRTFSRSLYTRALEVIIERRSLR